MSAGPVVGPSASDWELVGHFMEDGGRWLKMDDIYSTDPDAVPLYRKRNATPGTPVHSVPEQEAEPNGHEGFGS